MAFVLLNDKLPLLLCYLLQIADQSGIGLDLLAHTITSYQNITKPTTDDAKIQTWVKQQSYVLGRNTANYYLNWSWPVSAATQAELAYLPTWYPYAPPYAPPNISASIPTMTYRKQGSTRTATATINVANSTSGIASAVASGRWLFYGSNAPYPAAPSINTTWGPLTTTSGGTVSSTSPGATRAGNFTIIVTNATATGYVWDMVQVSRSVSGA